MLQHLLAERFGVMVHEENKARAGYALVVGKAGPKLQTAKETDGAGFRAVSDRVEFTNITMSAFAALLSRQMGRPVADRTGLPGHYNMTLNASMEDVRLGSVTGALQDLGLKLEPRTAPAKFVVVDKADRKPTEN